MEPFEEPANLPLACGNGIGRTRGRYDAPVFPPPTETSETRAQATIFEQGRIEVSNSGWWRLTAE